MFFNSDNRLLLFPLNIETPVEKVLSNEFTIALSSKTKNAEKALEFIEWVQSSQENYDLLTCGIEGVDYVFEGNKVKPLSKNQSINRSFLNIEYIRNLSHYAFDFKEFLKKYSDFNSNYADTVGFKPDYGKVQRYSSARISNYLNFERAQGVVNTDIGEFILQQKNDGVGKLVEELQQQLRDWQNDR